MTDSFDKAPMADWLNVRNFGAKGDGATLDSPAVQAAIDKAANMGGTVYFPAGTYLCGTLKLRSNTAVYISIKATVLGSGNFGDYKPENKVDEHSSMQTALFYGEDIQNICIGGPGKVDGNGEKFWIANPNHVPGDPNKMKSAGKRPALMLFKRCRQLVLRDLFIVNSPAYTVWAVACENVRITGLLVRNPRKGPNTDVLDIDGCRNVVISDCDIEAGDDCIALKSDSAKANASAICENIVVNNCIFATWAYGIRLGYEADDPIRDCSFNNIAIKDSSVGIGFNSMKTPAMMLSTHPTPIKKGTPIERVSFSNFRMYHVRRPIYIGAGNFHDASGYDAYVRHVDFSNISAIECGPIYLGSVDGNYISDIRLRNIRLHVSFAEVVESGNLEKRFQGTPDVLVPAYFGHGNLPYAFMLRGVTDVSCEDIKITKDPAWKGQRAVFTERAVNCTFNGTALKETDVAAV